MTCLWSWRIRGSGKRSVCEVDNDENYSAMVLKNFS